ncbi:hypothetical protein JVT61DRAFT_10732 [Boletus reticuloceps]|uniref:Uncharacterized protein n=1 Tax=Boletus reticuloceps TaxID=495285 RepID=A0A8I3A4P8_9AGAM|nr:hypothetical protein JVT61DRAFT_10732 [Boletus reticuloceps]
MAYGTGELAQWNPSHPSHIPLQPSTLFTVFRFVFFFPPILPASVVMRNYSPLGRPWISPAQRMPPPPSSSHPQVFRLQSVDFITNVREALRKEAEHAASGTGDRNCFPIDVLLVHGTCIVNEAILKKSIQHLDALDKIDANGAHKLEVLFNGTKVLQASPTSQGQTSAGTIDGGCLGVVLHTGLGTERDLKNSKLLFDCVLIIAGVVSPELSMELSLAVNASLMALSKFGTSVLLNDEHGQISQQTSSAPNHSAFPLVGACRFGKTGTITIENLVLGIE